MFLRDHLLNFRKDRGGEPLTCAVLCRGTGISPQAWSNWEVGRNYPDDESLERISRVTGDSVEELRAMSQRQYEALKSAREGLRKWIDGHMKRMGQTKFQAAAAMGVKPDTFRKWRGAFTPPGIESAYRLANWAGEVPPEHVSKAFGWIFGHGFGDGEAGPNRKVGPGARPSVERVAGCLPWMVGAGDSELTVMLVLVEPDADHRRVVEAMEMIRGVSSVVGRDDAELDD